MPLKQNQKHCFLESWKLQIWFSAVKAGTAFAKAYAGLQQLRCSTYRGRKEFRALKSILDIKI